MLRSRSKTVRIFHSRSLRHQYGGETPPDPGCWQTGRQHRHWPVLPPDVFLIGGIVNIVEKLRERRLLEHQTRAWRKVHGVCLVRTEDSELIDVLCSRCRQQLGSNWTRTNDSPLAIVQASSHCRGDSASPCSGTPFSVGTAPTIRNSEPEQSNQTRRRKDGHTNLLPGW